MCMKGENILAISDLLKIPSLGDKEDEGDFSGGSLLVIEIFFNLPLHGTADSFIPRL